MTMRSGSSARVSAARAKAADPLIEQIVADAIAR